ncbi:hypothetical protein BDN71DRAFT_1454517 [Pleurotus eryngii]|uniref:Uncharacterized protein n=1 Tax=Pleurotus eryngii TaxID=5323 RepID=A0A9P5ZR27_PLEER|nr:hypothetical protein BDN71DRAFT_1454517 [Pleurotus eryngii]
MGYGTSKLSMDPLLFAPVPSICAFVVGFLLSFTASILDPLSVLTSAQRTSKPPADPIPRCERREGRWRPHLHLRWSVCMRSRLPE